MSTSYGQVPVERARWRAWLMQHAATSRRHLAVTWKKGSGPYLPYDDVVDESLCFGWVDSQPRAVDDQRSSRLLTPRRPGSNLVTGDKQRVQRLTDAAR